MTGLTAAQTAALDELGISVFLAVKLAGELPLAIRDLDETQATAVRGAAVSIATKVLELQLRGTLPVGVTLDQGVTRFNLPPRPDQRVIAVGVVESYLDEVVEHWRAQREAGVAGAAAYIDAFQSARVSLLGSAKP